MHDLIFCCLLAAAVALSGRAFIKSTDVFNTCRVCVVIAAILVVVPAMCLAGAWWVARRP